MKLVTLMENTTAREDLACEHGLSLYLEVGDRRILFDAGQTGACIDNAEKLGIDLSKVDMAILSHGHYDHGGGLSRFLEYNRTAPVYVHRDAFMPHFSGTDTYIGLDPALLESGRLVFVEENVELDKGLSLHACNQSPRYYPLDTAGLKMEQAGLVQPEDFRHEQYLLVEEAGKRICISGCSHKGILNIVRWFTPDVLVGGFHFMKIDPQGPEAGRLDEAAAVLMEQPTVYYTGHCTGLAQYDYLKQIMGERLHAIQTGSTFLL